MSRPGDNPMARLKAVLARHDRLVLAVSGGVDSMTLAHAALRLTERDGVDICHAVSPAVPTAATARVRAHADRFGWRLRVLDAGEFADSDYLRNPVNRCYFCKSNLYTRIRQTVSGPVASGANLDDLGDYRPGLEAAREMGVRHPFIEAACTKADVRAMARQFGLDDISELPAQPCLASRIETGLRVEPEDLRFVELTEAALTPHSGAATLRVRVLPAGVRVELSDWNTRTDEERRIFRERAKRLCAASGRRLLQVADYRRGSAFRHDL
ncbi:adenine nucleotide alpha hydrolase [Tropicimonas aquimaris]|uniref:Adenine nucleotide alpha hydrolase n=1 Tax=Tropicimonas aquimaris TaxID=914152 RepID=A0ABW3IRA3_9RHOB